MNIGRRRTQPIRVSTGIITFAALVLACTATTVVVSVQRSGVADAAATARLTCNEPTQTGIPDAPILRSYTSITPSRVVDTREGLGGVAATVDAGCTLRLRLADSVVPADAQAVALSLTGLVETRGFLTAYSCADGRPGSSTLNARAGVATPNLVIAVPDAQRDVCIYASVAADMVIDVQGWWTDGTRSFRPVEPIRAYDTRELSPPTPLAKNSIRNVPVASEFVPDEATSVVVNLTAVNAEDRGWILAYPCGEPLPVASNLNYVAEESRAVAAIVGIGWRNGGEGQICVAANRNVDFIVDVVGYYAPEPDFGPSIELQPFGQRLVDTRDETGPWDAPFAAGEIREMDPTVAFGAPADATAVVINAVGVDPDKRGFLTVFPCTDEPPVVSTLNMFPGRAVSNLLTVELSDDGTICVLSQNGGNLVLDLVGVMVVTPDAPAQEIAIDGASVWPAYTIDGTNYALDCVDGINDIDVAVTPHRGRQVRIDGVRVDPGEPVELRLLVDDLVTVEMSAPGTDDVDLYFRCLPDDFPDLTVERPGAPAPGWYLTTFGNFSALSPYVVILDDHGAPVWYQRTDGYVVNAQLLSDGTLVYDNAEPTGFGFDPASTATNIELDGTVVQRISTDDPVEFPIDHHDLIERPGGWTVLGYPFYDPADGEGVDLTAVGLGADEPAVGSVIREITKPIDAMSAPLLEWSWDASDHFGVTDLQYIQRFNNYVPAPTPGEVGLFHINSIDRLGDGDYVASARHLDAVFRVNRVADADFAEGDVEWILASTPVAGWPTPDPNAALRLDIIGDPLGGPRRPHDTRLDGTTLTMFDNRTATGEPARAVAYRIDVAAGTATLLWQIDEPLGRSSSALGSVRVGVDGSRLVDWGTLQPMFNEFDAAGQLLLSISQAPFGNSYRIVKYDPSAFDADELRALASSSG